jgi:DNA repair protein RadC
MKLGRTLLDLGAERCSDAELLAILLGSGGRGYSALDSANSLLDKYGTLAGLMDRPLDEIADVKSMSGACNSARRRVRNLSKITERSRPRTLQRNL